MKQPGKALGGGMAGASAITLIHEALRQFFPHAPQIQRLGMQALEKIMNKTGVPVPENSNTLYGQALAGDLLSNTLFYSIPGFGKKPWLVGLLAGLGAGVAAVTLPKQLGLDESNVNKTPTTTAMTIGLYTLGGIIAAGVASLLTDNIRQEEDESKLKLDKLPVRRSGESWNLKD